MHFEAFRGRDVSEALSLVRAAYGGDAVIGGTRVVTGAGTDGPFVEVKAAAPGAADATRTARRTAPAPKAVPFRPPSVSSRSGAPRPPPPPTPHPLDGEIASLRALLDQMMSTKKPRERAQALLGAAGFEGPLVRELASAPLASQERDGVLAELRLRLRGTLRVVGCRLQSSGPVIVTCVGPTGSGKTTTLAKLAAKAKFELGRTVHVISLDTFRVGAIEQMKKFADLMDIPFSVAGDVASFEDALLEHDADVVLVDTPSRAPSDGASLARLHGCLAIARERAQTEVLLVVPSYLRTNDVERLAAGYASCAPSAIILTKIDEAERLGGAVGGAVRTGLPLAYLSAGPRVPEDLSTAELDLADIALPGRA